MRSAAILSVLVLSACGGPLSLLTGGGPNVAANVQAGAENNQSIGVTSRRVQSIVRPKARDIEQTADTRVRTDSVQTIIQNEIPAWIIWALVAATFLDSPLRWPGQIINTFKRRRTKET